MQYAACRLSRAAGRPVGTGKSVVQVWKALHLAQQMKECIYSLMSKAISDTPRCRKFDHTSLISQGSSVVWCEHALQLCLSSNIKLN